VKSFRIHSQACAVLALTFVMLFAFYCRRNALWLPHGIGDQSHYLSLAAKLDRYGYKRFNMRGIKVLFRWVHKSPQILAVEFLPIDPDIKGDMIDQLESMGVSYYDKPLFWKSPAYPYLLMLSHRLFAPGEPYAVIETNLGEKVSHYRTMKMLKTQFWAAIIPLAANLGIVFLTFFLGWKLFSARTGLYAAFLMAIHPVSILTSHRIWTEDVMIFFILSGMALACSSISEKHGWIFLFSGVFFGLAILIKQTALLIVVPIVFLLAQGPAGKGGWLSYLTKVFFNKRILLFSLACLCVTAPWFFKVFATYGNPFYQPQERDFSQDVSGWFATLNNRPAPYILFTAGLVYLWPLAALMVLSVKRLFISLREYLKSPHGSYPVLFLWIWILSYAFLFCVLQGGKEHRYMYPVYPPIALLSGLILSQWRDAGYRKIKSFILADGWIMILLLLCAYWSVPIGLQAVFKGEFLLLVPF